MDNVVCSSPQFIEFLAIAWLGLNSPLLKLDPDSFNSTLRPVQIGKLLKAANKIAKLCPPNLLYHHQFTPLSLTDYPKLEGQSDAVVMRSLQSDQDKVALIRKKILQEKEESEKLEKTKLQKKQTFDAVKKIQNQRTESDRIEASKASNDLNREMIRIQQEEHKIRLLKERQFLESWELDWINGLNSIQRASLQPPEQSNLTVSDPETDHIILLEDLRVSDMMVRQARNSLISRQKRFKDELQSETHKHNVKIQIDQLTQNSNFSML